LYKYFDALSKFGNLFSKDIGAIFDRIGANNFIVDSNYIAKNGSSSQTRGMAPIRHGQRLVYSVKLNLPNVTNDPQGTIAAESRYNNYTAVALAEITHHAKEKGVYTDAQLDKAALSLLTPQERDKVKKENKDNAVGTIGHNAVSAHCTPTNPNGPPPH
jgi:hypothetical protein